MTKHKEQRVAVFVDVQNMYYSAKNLFGRKVSFAMLLRKAVGLRKLVRAFAYAIKADVADEQNFRDALFNIGYEVKTKDLQVFVGGHKKGDWDVGIAMDMVRMANKIDVAVLVSGDGDFRALLEYLRSMGCRTEVIAFGKAASQKMFDETDSYIDMDKNTRRFLIHDRSYRPARKSEGENSDTEQSPPKQ